MGLQVAAIARLEHLITFVEESAEHREWLTPIRAYQAEYGIRG